MNKKNNGFNPTEVVVCCHGTRVVLEVNFPKIGLLEIMLDDPREFARDIFQAADIVETRTEERL